MIHNKKYNIAKCTIKFCIVLCAFFIVGALLYYFNYLHEAVKAHDETWDLWYNFLSPIIAIANVIAFIGLTAALFFGEREQHRQRERIHISESILTKIYSIEQELSISEKALRSQNVSLIDIYSAYIAVYRAHYYFETLHSISTLSEEEKEAMQVLRDAFLQTENQMAIIYEAQKKKSNKSSMVTEARECAQSICHLTGMLNMMEANMMQQMANNIKTDASEPLKG